MNNAASAGLSVSQGKIMSGKGKKGKASGLTSEHIFQLSVNASLGQEAARRAVADVIDSSANVLWENHLLRLVEEQLPLQLMEQMMQVVDWSHLAHDKGDSLPPHNMTEQPQQLQQSVGAAVSSSDIASINGTWVAEEEPQPSPVDRWARGVVPVQRRARGLMESVMASQVTGVDKPRSVNLPSKWDTASRGSANNRGTTPQTPSRGDPKERSVRSRGRGGKSNTAITATVSASASASATAAASTTAAANPMPKRVPHPPRNISSAERRTEEMRQRELKRMEREKLGARQKAELKKKQEKEASSSGVASTANSKKATTTDEHGRPIPVTPVASAHLPVFQTPPRVSVHSPSGNAPDSARSKKGRAGRQRGKNAQKSLRTNDVAAAVAGAPTRTRQKNHSQSQSQSQKGDESSDVVGQPPLVNVIHLESGVTVRDVQSGAVKSHKRTPPKVDPEELARTASPIPGAMQLSRAQYNELVDKVADVAIVQKQSEQAVVARQEDRKPRLVIDSSTILEEQQAIDTANPDASWGKNPPRSPTRPSATPKASQRSKFEALGGTSHRGPRERTSVAAQERLHETQVRRNLSPLPVSDGQDARPSSSRAEVITSSKRTASLARLLDLY